jgi:hypothetical protein
MELKSKSIPSSTLSISGLSTAKLNLAHEITVKFTAYEAACIVYGDCCAAISSLVYSRREIDNLNEDDKVVAARDDAFNKKVVAARDAYDKKCTAQETRDVAYFELVKVMSKFNIIE